MTTKEQLNDFVGEEVCIVWQDCAICGILNAVYRGIERDTDYHVYVPGRNRYITMSVYFSADSVREIDYERFDPIIYLTDNE